MKKPIIIFHTQQLFGYSHLTAVVLLWFILASKFSVAQQPLTIQFKALFGAQTLILNDSNYTITKGRVRIETLKFYISSIQLLNQNKIVYQEKLSFHLIDISDSSQQSLTLIIPKNTNYTNLKFNLGIDSITNTSGAMGGDLDPTKGMYWTWQSGYINFKFEGTSDFSKHPKKEFQYHIGGYQNPFATIQTINLEIFPNKKLLVGIDTKQALESIQICSTDHIMSPTLEAVKISKALKQCFKIVKE